MFGIILLLASSIFFLNGLATLGIVSERAAAPMNIISGLVMLFSLTQVMLTLDPSSPSSPHLTLAALGYLTFAASYLYYGALVLTNSSREGHGYYCAWACITSVYIAVSSMVILGDDKGCILWAVWTVLFGVMCASTLRRSASLRRFAGLMLVATGVSTCLFPGMLLTAGKWAEVSGMDLLGLQGVAALALLLVMRSSTAAASPVSDPN